MVRTRDAKNKKSLSAADRKEKLLACEKLKWAEGFSFVAGVDEAGRGCMAGPVVAAAVIFTEEARIPEGIDDSKKLTPEKRMFLREQLLAEKSIYWGIGLVEPEEIDQINILQATWKAMRLAVEALQVKADFILVDGNPVKGLPCPSMNIIKGDSTSLSIGAASILAKTHRDLLMEKMAEQYPQYGFEIHKGYCTRSHIAAVREYGPCPIHRMTFEPVKSILDPPPLIQPDLF